MLRKSKPQRWWIRKGTVTKLRQLRDKLDSILKLHDQGAKNNIGLTNYEQMRYQKAKTGLEQRLKYWGKYARLLLR